MDAKPSHLPQPSSLGAGPLLIFGMLLARVVLAHNRDYIWLVSIVTQPEPQLFIVTFALILNAGYLIYWNTASGHSRPE